METSEKLANTVVLILTFDARKMMKQYHQTMYALRIVNLRKIGQSPHSMILVGLSEGHDTNFFLSKHSTDAKLVDTLDKLETGELELLTPEGTKLKVVTFISADGAARRTASGQTSATSTYPLTWSYLPSWLVKKLALYAPITLTEAFMRAHRPAGEMSHAQRLRHAREHWGIYSKNFTGRDMNRFVPEVLHQLLLTINRVMSFTVKAILHDENSDLDEFKHHARTCLRLKHKFIHIETDGRVMVTLKGNDCKRLKGLPFSIVNCDTHSLMTDDYQRQAITKVWSSFMPLLHDSTVTDPSLAMSPGRYFTEMHRTLEIAVAVFGQAFITPTLREMRDQNPYFKKMLAGEYGLTLADFDMEAAEHENKLEKGIFLRGFRAGGRGNGWEPIRQLMVY